ncbi:MAG: AAA family ATPase [Chloroflexi bacterium]|nr:AAA family ATPase [Chloroflexota bacterium]
MRIDGWEIDAFGPISGWTQHGLAEHGVVVIAGDNETGKSALFEFLTTALFGFAPATAGNHPYSPWGGGFPGGALLASLGDGRSVRLARRLTSRPQGTIEIDGQPRDLANRPVTWVGGLARAIFTNLHAVTQEDALGMDPRTWQSVEDRMLGGASFDFLRPAREVVAQLDQDRQALWRPDRRGRPRAVEIRERLSALREELRPASGRRAEIEASQDRLAKIAEGLDAIERGPQGLQAIEVMLERDATLSPIVRRARRTARLGAEAASLVANDDFELDPRAKRNELRDAVASGEQRIGEIDAEIEQLAEAREIDSVHQTALARRDLILELQAEIPLHVEDDRRIEQMSGALHEESGGFGQIGERVLDRDLDADTLETLRDLRVAESRGRFEAWTVAVADADYRAVEQRHAVETAERTQREREVLGDVPDLAQAHGRVQSLLELGRAEALTAAGGGAPSRAWRVAIPVLVALAGAAAIVVGIFLGGTVLAILASVGASLAAAAAVDLSRIVTARRRAGAGPAAAAALRKRADIAPDTSAADALDDAMRQRDAARRAADIDQRLATAKVAIEDAARREDEAALAATAARNAWLELIPNVPIAPVQLKRPRETLLRDVEELRDSLARTHALIEDRRTVQERIDHRLRRLQALRDELDLNPAADVVPAVAELGRKLTAAEAAKGEAEAAAGAIAKLRDERRQVGDARDVADTELGLLETQLARLDPVEADPDAGLDRLERARAARDEATRARADLDRETPNWRERVSEADRLEAQGEAIELTDDRRVELRRRGAELQEEANGLRDERGGLTRDVQEMEALPGPAHVQGAIEEALAELEEVQRAHDRLALLAAAISAAERAYRDAHQSPLLEAASAHLASITGGRYDRLIADDSTGDGVRLHVRRRGEAFPVVVDHPLSRGTLQQIYLALRLAMVDQVEGEDAERLPLFMDEMFVNWDPSRTGRGMVVLREIGRSRQVFLFTADPAWAERTSAQADAIVVATPRLAG